MTVLKFCLPLLFPVMLIIGISTAGNDGQSRQVTWNDVYETEPNDSCEQANWINIGDRVFCGHINFLVPPYDPQDYFRFEIFTTQEICIGACWTGNDCSGQNNCIAVGLYNDDCSNLIDYNVGVFEPGNMVISISDVLQPGIYNIRIDIGGNDICSGPYHLTLESLNPIPTLSEWGILIMALLLLAAATVAVVRRKKSVVTE